MEKMWYYAQGGKEKQGPVSEAQIKAMVADGQLQASDLVWAEGMASWTAISSTPEFQDTPVVIVPVKDPNSLPAGLLRWMNFVGVCTIIWGVFSCLSCFGIINGVFMIISGTALVGARTALINCKTIGNELQPFFQKLKTFFVMTGVMYVIMIVMTALIFVFYFAVIVAALGGVLHK